LLADLAHFTGLELPVDQSTIAKKHFFFSKTENFKAFLSAAALVPVLISDYELQK
jgi:hypothetical protein